MKPWERAKLGEHWALSFKCGWTPGEYVLVSRKWGWVFVALMDVGHPAELSQESAEITEGYLLSH